ncbi:MAG: hypothetical protein A2Y93_05895 [Chloroflexi bacterium RBG_13_68_17]|nr:MAG: hypothetical protein A2Y93_05895 [Chloroflexi bacterium RBG_13_68_17]
MARVQETTTLPGKSADAAYGAAESVLSAAGYQLTKRRPIAWLLLAHRQQAGGSIEVSFTARPGPAAAVTLSLSSEELDEGGLKSEALHLLEELAK